MDVIDINRTFHPTTQSFPVYIELSLRYVLDHKTNLRIFKRIEIMKNIFSDHNRIILKIKNREITEKATNTWKLNSTSK